ncbi:MAG: aldehyde dehydrogenase family protein [Nocardioidaceae bacterium]
MEHILKPGTSWDDAYTRSVAAAPEAFHEDRILNLWGGQWRRDGSVWPSATPVDGTPLPGPPRLSCDVAKVAVRAAVDQHRAWGDVSLAERKERVTAALDALDEHRDLLSLLLVWEIGKPWRLATTDVDRCIDGVRWYVEEIDRMLVGRAPLDGPVSNIASWNYPMSVLMHAVLIQALAGNGVIAKTPTDGGVACLTLACALAKRAGLPISLVSGSGSELSHALVRADDIGCLSFVGGRDVGGRLATTLANTNKRHILEQEGLNCWGIWEYSGWQDLTKQIRKTHDYAKQRCTAYPRFVVQRGLFSEFLSAYLPAVQSIGFGHPLAVERPEDDLPSLDFGPLISDGKAKELGNQVDEAIAKGGVPLYRGGLDSGVFLPGQNTDAYMAPVAILSPPPSSPLHHSEPFGPVDTIVLVDTEAELLAAMNASNGALVSTISCDDEDTAARLAGDVRSFKVGINAPRSRGDRNELFGGKGASWQGAFVGGELLVRSVTQGPGDDKLPGNFPTYSLYPPT